jgi:hypothetical protein
MTGQWPFFEARIVEKHHDVKNRKEQASPCSKYQRTTAAEYFRTPTGADFAAPAGRTEKAAEAFLSG